MASLTEPVGGRYDLMCCIEILEHIPTEQCEQVIRNLTAASDTLLFSSTPLDTTEKTHCNVRPVLS